jgi:hypothetical protein
MTTTDNFISAPDLTEHNFISLGAGVQSSTMALMAAHGIIKPMPNAAIFADTQAEPQVVYDWLEWLEKQLPFPVYKVTAGNLTKVALTMRNRKSDGGQYTRSLLPCYTMEPDGSIGVMMRACTTDYKLVPLRRTQRKLGNVKRGQKECTVTSWIGISWDEVQRMKVSKEAWVQHRWPLVERHMTRYQCKEWMANNKYPEPPRSACVYCPFHSDREWRHLRDDLPHEFARAIQFEKDLQSVKLKTCNMRSIPYLHPSRIPLEKIEFRDKHEGQLTLWNTMQNECEGMCGV